MFSTIAQRLDIHVSHAEERCRCFETEARGMKKETRSGPLDCEAAANWWWREVGGGHISRESQRLPWCIFSRQRLLCSWAIVYVRPKPYGAVAGTASKHNCCNVEF